MISKDLAGARARFGLRSGRSAPAEAYCAFHVPTLYRKDGLKLGWWVATQRRNKKELSPERRRRLDKVGFFWNVPRMGPVAYRPSPAICALIALPTSNGRSIARQP